MHTEQIKDPIYCEVINKFWDSLITKNKNYRITDKIVSFFETWESIEELLEKTSSLNEKQSYEILKFLKINALRVLRKNEKKSTGWIHLLGFLSKKMAIQTEGDSASFKLEDEVVKFVNDINNIYKQKDSDKKKSSFNKISQDLFIFLISLSSYEDFFYVIDQISTSIERNDNNYIFWSEHIFPEDAEWWRDELLSVLMHLLGISLISYKNKLNPMNRSKIEFIILILLRRFIYDLNRCSAFISNFFGTNRGRNFDSLQYKELCLLFDELKKNDELYHKIKQNETIIRKLLFSVLTKDTQLDGSDEKDIKEQIKEKLNDILHGEEKPDEIKWQNKLSNICQVTFLVRKSKLSRLNPYKREYTEYFEYEGLKLAPMRLIKANDKRYWKLEDKKKSDIFNYCVEKAWEGGIHVKNMSQLFKSIITEPNIKEQQEFPGIFWIPDGEITFYLLIFIILKTQEEGKFFAKWVKEESQIGLDLSIQDFLPPGQSYKLDNEYDLNNRIKQKFNFMGKFENFFTEKWVLFDTEKKPGDKFWSLYDFLELCVVGSIEINEDLKNLIKCFYEILKEDNENLFMSFQKALEDLNDKLLINPHFNNIIEFLKRTRLYTFMLEIIFRWEEKLPRTLFFYPMMFEKFSCIASDSMKRIFTVPTIFMAGTLMGIEKPERPFVSNLADIYIISLMELIKPFSYYFLGKQIERDEKLLVEKSTLETTSKWAHALKTRVEFLKPLSKKNNETKKIDNIFKTISNTLKLRVDELSDIATAIHEITQNKYNFDNVKKILDEFVFNPANIKRRYINIIIQDSIKTALNRIITDEMYLVYQGTRKKCIAEKFIEEIESAKGGYDGSVPNYTIINSDKQQLLLFGEGEENGLSTFNSIDIREFITFLYKRTKLNNILSINFDDLEPGEIESFNEYYVLPEITKGELRFPFSALYTLLLDEIILNALKHFEKNSKGEEFINILIKKPQFIKGDPEGNANMYFLPLEIKNSIILSGNDIRYKAEKQSTGINFIKMGLDIFSKDPNAGLLIVDKEFIQYSLKIPVVDCPDQLKLLGRA